MLEKIRMSGDSLDQNRDCSDGGWHDLDSMLCSCMRCERTVGRTLFSKCTVHVVLIHSVSQHTQ